MPLAGAAASVRSIRRLGDQREIKVDVRLLAATNRDLHRAIAAGTFREDLFYRLATLSIRLPALRDRRSDIPQIAEKLLTLINRQFAAEEPSYSHKSISASAIAFVKQQPWPGNVRQLSNTLVQAAVLADGVTLSRGDLASALGELPSDGAPLAALSAITLEPGFNLDEYLNAIHRQLLQRAMRQSQGIKADAARLLGIDNYQTLAARLKRLGANDSGEPAE